MPLPLPEEPCLHWTTDAVSGLPRTKRGYDSIQVYVDRLTKLKRFAATRTTDGCVELAATTLRTIIAAHGMPKSMVSDRDPRITAPFWKELSRVMGSQVNLSTAYHPQSDGQSEREIKTLITTLRGYVNAHGTDWDEYCQYWNCHSIARDKPAQVHLHSDWYMVLMLGCLSTVYWMRRDQLQSQLSQTELNVSVWHWNMHVHIQNVHKPDRNDWLIDIVG